MTRRTLSVVDYEAVVQLADDGDLHAVLAAVSLGAIADAWWRYTMRWEAARRNSFPEPTWETDPDSWAEQVWQSEVLFQREDVVREFLSLAAIRAPEGADLGYLGAGPVEDFLTNEARLLWSEHEAAVSRNFRAALANVYPRSSLNEEQNARIRRAAQSD